MTEANRLAYEHYLECRAVGEWPIGQNGMIDGQVRRDAAIIRSVYDEVEQSDRDKMEWFIRALAMPKG